MRRVLVAAGAAALLAILPYVAVFRAAADDVLTSQVTCTTTRATLLAANPNRLGAVVQNVGTLHVNVGRGTTMITLHVGASLSTTPGYRGGLDCQTQAGTGSTVVETYEDVR